MAITYQYLNTEVHRLASKLLNVEEFSKYEEIDDETLKEIKEAIEETKKEIARTIFMGTIMQINPDLTSDDDTPDVPLDTQLTAETLFAIGSDLELYKKQNILLDLIYDFIDKEGDEIDDVFVMMMKEYDLNGMEGLNALILEKNLVRYIGESKVLPHIITLVMTGTDFYMAIEKTLIEEFSVDPNNPEVIQNIEYPQEIRHFIDEVSKLLLSKMGIPPVHLAQTPPGKQ